MAKLFARIRGRAALAWLKHRRYWIFGAGSSKGPTFATGFWADGFWAVGTWRGL